MEWIYLFIASIFEVGWTISMKSSDGLTRFYPTVSLVVCLIISMGLLERAVRTLPIGTAYAVWTGIGIIGTALLGIVFFNKPADMMRILCILLITAGIVGLKLLPAQ